jgi:LPXTG-motif cell wall-anchored protein
LKTLLALSIIFALLLTTFVSASAQQPQLASYRETAHILVDEKVQNKTTAFVTLASTSPVEMRVPADLSLKVQNTANVTSVVITNAENCIVGVQDQGCVLVNIVSPSLVETYDINKIQADAKQVGDSLIDSINKAFATNAQFNSVYVNPRGDLSSALGTSGAVSGNRTISVIYTMSRPDSSYLFDGLTAILIPKQIRDDGGFFNAAQKMAQDSNSTVTFVITPGQGTSLYQLQVSKQVPITGPVTTVKPLELFGVDKLQRSSYFDVGFFPLNSILDVTAISNDNISITNHGGDLAPSEIKDGQKFPTDLTKSGWIIDPEYGQKVSAVYLFGKDTSVTNDQAFLTLGNTMPTDNTPGQDNTTSPPPVPKTSNDYSIYVLIGIVAAGGAAVYLFMKRR